jgi:hypothetical protein
MLLWFLWVEHATIFHYKKFLWPMPVILTQCILSHFKQISTAMFLEKPYTLAGIKPGSSRSWGICDVHYATPGQDFSSFCFPVTFKSSSTKLRTSLTAPLRILTALPRILTALPRILTAPLRILTAPRLLLIRTAPRPRTNRSVRSCLKSVRTSPRKSSRSWSSRNRCAIYFWNADFSLISIWYGTAGVIWANFYELHLGIKSLSLWMKD